MDDFVDAPFFSSAERDLRWERVRQLMRAQNWDCLVTPPGSTAATRYLAQIGGADFAASVIFPAEGNPWVHLTRKIQEEAAARARVWVEDMSFDARPAALGERLRATGLVGRLAVVSMGDEVQGESANLAQALGQELAPASVLVEPELLRNAQLVKSQEEIELIQLGLVANEFAFSVLCSRGRPGASKGGLLEEMGGILARASGGVPGDVDLGFEGIADPGMALVTPDIIPAGCLCSAEITARIFGYQVESGQTVEMGDGAADYPDAMRATFEVFNEVCGWARPGVTVREVCEYFEVICRAKGVQPVSERLVRGCGVVAWPWVGPRSAKSPDGDIELQVGHTFTLRPSVRLTSGTTTEYGEPVTIAEDGGRRLGKRAQIPIRIAAAAGGSDPLAGDSGFRRR